MTLLIDHWRSGSVTMLVFEAFWLGKNNITHADVTWPMMSPHGIKVERFSHFPQKLMQEFIFSKNRDIKVRILQPHFYNKFKFKI